MLYYYQVKNLIITFKMQIKDNWTKDCKYEDYYERIQHRMDGEDKVPMNNVCYW